MDLVKKGETVTREELIAAVGEPAFEKAKEVFNGTPAPGSKLIERIARAMCKAERNDPDAMCIGRGVELQSLRGLAIGVNYAPPECWVQPAWTLYAHSAEAAIVELEAASMEPSQPGTGDRPAIELEWNEEGDRVIVSAGSRSFAVEPAQLLEKERFMFEKFMSYLGAEDQADEVWKRCQEVVPNGRCKLRGNTATQVIIDDPNESPDTAGESVMARCGILTTEWDWQTHSVEIAKGLIRFNVTRKFLSEPDNFQEFQRTLGDWASDANDAKAIWLKCCKVAEEAEDMFTDGLPESESDPVPFIEALRKQRENDAESMVKDEAFQDQQARYEAAGQVGIRNCKNDFGGTCPECGCNDGDYHAAICRAPERVYGTPPLAPAEDKAE
jgi:hypothetical protein